MGNDKSNCNHTNKKILNQFKADHPEYILDNAEDLISDGTIDEDDIGDLFSMDVTDMAGHGRPNALRRELREAAIKAKREVVEKEGKENNRADDD